MIPEEMIKSHLDWLMTGSEPGAILHHLVTLTAPPGALSPLGLVDEKQLHTDIAALAPTEAVDVEQFIVTAIGNEKIRQHREGAQVVFAALGREDFTAPMDELGLQLRQQGRLQDHPEAAEVTRVYAVCRDGRRWRGQHWLTGPRAGGTLDEPVMLVGRFDRQEGPGPAVTRAMLRLVGLIP